MKQKEKISSHFKDMRLIALERLMKTKKGCSRRSLSAQLNLGETTIQKWFEDNRWPGRDDEKIERYFGVRPGFFQQIANGTPYDDALKASSTPAQESKGIDDYEHWRIDELAVLIQQAGKEIERRAQGGKKPPLSGGENGELSS